MPIHNTAHSTFSFSEVDMVLTHPDLGQLVLTGQGAGNITISYANDSSAHDVANDGSVMTSKIVARNGTLVFSAQQTSEANQIMHEWHNKLLEAYASAWAQISGRIQSRTTNETTMLSGMSIQKNQDRTYQQTGQVTTWTLLASTIITEKY